MTEYNSDLKACRLCLETNCKLYHINENNLAYILDEFTSSTASDMPGIPPYVCSFCCALLRKATFFRRRCVAMQNYLHEFSQNEPLTMDIIQNMDTSKIKNQFNTSDIVIMYTIDDINKQNELKLENILDHEDGNEIYEDGDDNYQSINPPDFVKLDEDIKPIIQNVISKSVTNNKDTISKDEISKNELKDVLQQLILETTDEHKIAFYSFVLEKYVWGMKTNLTNPFDSDDELLKRKLPNATDLKKMDPNERILYKYVIEKYKKGTLKKKKLQPIVNLPARKQIKEDADKKVLIPDKKIQRSKTEQLELNVMKSNPKSRKCAFKCEVCSRRFKSEKSVRQHSMLVHDMDALKNFEKIELSKKEQLAELSARQFNPHFIKSKFKCEVCFRGFKTEKTLQTHLFVHDPRSGAVVCEICKSRFPDHRKLAEHVHRHKWKFVCKLCGVSKKNSTEARFHNESHDAKTYDCEHCGKVFNRYKSRMEHIRIHHGAVRCDICYKGLTNQIAVKLHKCKSHKQVFICDVCNVVFNKKSALNTHLGSLKTTCVNVRPCSACGENLKTEAELEEHINNVHPYKRPDLNRHRKTGCCPCGHGLNDNKPESNTSVNTTEQTKETNRNFIENCKCPCKLVGKTRKRRRPMEEEDAPKQKYMCEVCAQENFLSIFSLREHQRIHTGEKPYQCEICNRRFRVKCLLQMHMPVHTGERAYKCLSCDKTFKTAAASYRHRLVHSGVRRHKCSMCDKLFQTSSCLKTHVKSVHMKLPYPPSRANGRRRKPNKPDYVLSEDANVYIKISHMD